MSTITPLVLMILDGWGYSEAQQHNAIAKAKTPQWDAWWAQCPHILLDASGKSVGLPDLQMGNSEVGHMHIGAGRVVQQDLTRINEAISTGAFASNETARKVIHTLKKSNKKLHLMGLLSPGGVHSHEDHLFALLALCHQMNFHSVCLHLFLDGRDMPPQSALRSIARLNAVLKEHPVGLISSVSGRYFAMDRDQRWERIQGVYDLITQGFSTAHFDTAQQAVEFYYQNKRFDEFIPPSAIGTAQPLEEGDALLFFNFRADRARQLSAAFIDPSFDAFKKSQAPKLSYFISMTQYDKNLPSTCLFPPIPMQHTLGELIAQKGLRQLRIAETEKYAHVTFFFNGGQEQLFDGEDRIMIPSPKVATYDLQPQMSAAELTDALVQAIETQKYDVIICNYANADMVGHSGNFDAAVAAIECLDGCMKRVWDALSLQKGRLLITSDHGNAEAMFDDHTHQPHTAHTSEPVPLLYVGGGWHFSQSQGSLIDIAPSILRLIGADLPPEMTGKPLLEQENA